MRAMTTRAARVAKEMQRQMSTILRDDLRDPRIGFTTITQVAITADLRSAHVYFTILGNHTQQNNAIAALQHACPFVRRLIGQRMNLRIVPEITFERDKGIESSFKVDQILRDLEKERASREKRK